MSREKTATHRVIRKPDGRTVGQLLIFGQVVGEVDLEVVAKPEIPGLCCSCGYSGEEETPCPGREDQTHCVHWWEGES